MNVLSCVRRVVRRGNAGTSDESGFALIYAVLFIAMLALLSSAILAVVINEFGPTQFQRKREQTLNSAEAGIDEALAQLRSATSGALVGSPAYLPCGSGTQTSYGVVGPGAVDSNGDTYLAAVYYFSATNSSGGSADPTGDTFAAVASGNAPGELTCSFKSASPPVVPAFAYVSSQGLGPALHAATGTTGNRQLHAVYTFNTGYTVGLGGKVRSAGLCWTAPTNATVGSQVSFSTCLLAGTPSQLWYYRPDLTIQWVGSTSSTPLCLDYTGFTPGSSSSVVMTLQKCLSAGISGDAFNNTSGTFNPSGLAYQEFVDLAGTVLDVGVNGDASSKTGFGHGSSCVAAQSLVTPILTMSTGCANTTLATVATDVGVGTGDAAGASNGAPGATGQLSNYLYNNTCFGLLVTPNNEVSPPGGESCGESPDLNVGQNTVFAYAGTGLSSGTISSYRTTANCTRADGSVSNPCVYGSATQPYCMTTPSSAGGVISFVLCNGNANQKWQLTETVKQGNAVDFRDSYLVKDNNGLCLTLTAAPNPAFYNIAPATVQTCNMNDPAPNDVRQAELDQKWNVPIYSTASVGGYGEDQHS